MDSHSHASVAELRAHRAVCVDDCCNNEALSEAKITAIVRAAAAKAFGEPLPVSVPEPTRRAA